METLSVSGHECIALENGSLRLLVTRSVGPRILSFGFKNGENLFAELPGFVTDLPDGGVFHFHGGHRLWQAPEDFHTTYIPDDDPVEIVSMQNGLFVKQKTQPRTGLQKTLDIQFTGETQAVITHRITNCGDVPVTCAPWAITQLRTGGLAVLPQSLQDAGMLPNRSLALWSYSDMSNRNVTWGREYVLVSAQMEAPFKVGFSNPRGWLAYWLNGVLFVKRANYAAQSDYYDFGSSSECYCNDKFLELETLAPITTLEPGADAVHVETWELYKDVERPLSEQDVQTLVERLELEK